VRHPSLVSSHHPLLPHLVVLWIKPGSRNKFLVVAMACLTVNSDTLSTVNTIAISEAQTSPDDPGSSPIDFPLEDPHLAVCPNFSGGPWETLRKSLATEQKITEQEAITRLADAWKETNDQELELWDRELEEQRKTADEATHQAELQRQKEAEEMVKESEREKREANKKKPKLPDFESDSCPPDFLRDRASQYARKKLENFEYVELWYFTPEGCADAAKENLTTADDALGFTHTGDHSISLRPLATSKPSRNVIPDADLTWRQMSMGKTGMLIDMKCAKWTEKHRNALASFFYDLEVHHYRSRPNGETILLIYQARVRRAWHDGLASGDTFNIAIPNDNLLRALADEYYDRSRAKRVSFLVSSISIPVLTVAWVLNCAINRISPPFSLCLIMSRHIMSRHTVSHLSCMTPILPCPTLKLLETSPALTVEVGISHQRSRTVNPSRGSRRSASPPGWRPFRPSSSSHKTSGFRRGAGSPSLSACAICLGRHPHNVSACSSPTTWDGSAARCKRAEGARIVNPSGLSLCVKWQLKIQCTSLFHGDGHECSGCGAKDHGAQKCPRAEKA
jgi:hypothetical protein